MVVFNARMAWSRAVHRIRHRTRWAGALLLAGLLGLSAAHADSDHDRARAALRAGEVLPLQVVLQRVQAEYPGRVLGIKLEREDGRWIYEVKLLDPSGQLNKLELNAATGAVLRLRRR
jgi:uncharacterized membrane protein YkoI